MAKVKDDFDSEVYFELRDAVAKELRELEKRYSSTHEGRNALENAAEDWLDHSEIFH